MRIDNRVSKKILPLILIFSLLNLLGCSVPAAAKYSQLYSFTKEEKINKGSFGLKQKVELLKDFREDEMYSEDIDALKIEVEKYIAANPDLDEVTKNNLRELKLTPGATKPEVSLLLGEPDKTGNSGDLWIYRISRIRAFIFFIFPYFFAHEGYYLYFEDNHLKVIEKHYPEQIFHQASAPGLSRTTGPKK